MPIGRDSNVAVKVNRATGLKFAERKLIVLLADGREVRIPLSFYPTLANATPRQRNDWQLIGPDKGFYWPKLDLDLSIDGLIQGLRERVPRPPLRMAGR